VVAVERNISATPATLLAKPAATATAPTRTMIASAHALNVHDFSVTLSIMRTRRMFAATQVYRVATRESPAAN